MTDDQGQSSSIPASPDSSRPAEGGAFSPSQPPASPYAQPQQPPAPVGRPSGFYGQQPPAPGSYGQPSIPPKGGRAIGALVCGILAIVFAWAPVLGIVLGIVAIVLAVKAAKETGKDGKATGGKVCGIIGIALSVIVFVSYLALAAGLALVSAQPGFNSVTGTWENNAGIIGELAKSDAEEQSEAAAAAELDKLKNADDQVVQYIADSVDEGFVSASGYSLTEVGIAPTDVAQWMLDGFDYELDGTSLYESEGVGVVYANVTMRDVYALTDTFYADVQAYAESGDPSLLDEAAVKAKLGEILKAAMDKTSDLTTDYAGVDVIESGSAWVVDGDSWSDEVDYLFSLY